MDIFIKSLAAAIITALILMLEKTAGPKVAGAIGGIPIVFAISFIFITMGNKDITHISHFLIGGIVGGLAGVSFCLLLWFLNAKFIEYYWLNFVVAYVLCFLFALGVVQLVSR